MRTVYKYPLELADVQDVRLPRASEILHVAEQHGSLFLWAWVNTSEPHESVTIAICGTGHPTPEPHEARHIGSVVMTGGHLVWHVFRAAGETA